jgi:N-acetyl sugar amidotransferase
MQSHKPQVVVEFSKIIINETKFNKYAKKNKQILDEQIEKLPKKVIFCKKCVTSNQRPRTEFDKEGICSACRYAEIKFGGGIDWDKRGKELIQLLDKHRSKDGSWDVIVPSSHGKDSAMVTHQLKEKYGMHPLTVTWAPFIYTEVGFKNYVNMNHAGFDGLVAWPNGILHRKLARTCFELKGDPFEAFVYGQKAYPFRIAQKFKIPLIFYGENGEAEYGGIQKYVDKSHETPDDWEEEYYKGAGFEKVVQEGFKMGIFDEKEIKNNAFDFYRAPPLEEIKKLGLEMHWWSYYKTWIPQEHYYYAHKNTGLEAAESRHTGTYTKFANLDDAIIDAFHWLMAYIKLGWGRTTREASSDIRCGHITREEGVALTHKYDHEFPQKYLETFLKYMSITEKYFWEVLDRYRSEKIWHKVNGKWKRKIHVSNNSVHGEEPTIE